MTKPSRIIGDHVLYGQWDSDGRDEVLVHYHPNGIDTHVFVLSGFDYGGGVIKEFPMKASVLEQLWKDAETAQDFHTTLSNMKVAQ